MLLLLLSTTILKYRGTVFVAQTKTNQYKYTIHTYYQYASYTPTKWLANIPNLKNTTWHTHTHANIDNIIAIMARTCHLYCETNRKRSPHFSRYHKCPVYGGNIGDGCFSGFHILAVSWLLYRLFLRSSLSQRWRWQSTVSWHRIWILWAKTKC